MLIGWRVKPCGNPRGYFTAYYRVSDPLGLDVRDVDVWHFPYEAQAVEFGRQVNLGLSYEAAARTVEMVR